MARGRIRRLAAWAFACGGVGAGLSFASAVVACLRADRAGAFAAAPGGPGPGVGVGTGWLWPTPPGWGAPTVWMSRVVGSTRFEERYWVESQWPARGGQQEFTAGWPIAGWRWRRESAPGAAEPRVWGLTADLQFEPDIGGVVWIAPAGAGWPMPHAVTFPVTPNGWRFVGSAAVYAAGVGVLGAGIAAGKRAWVGRRSARRRREGRCDVCGYCLDQLSRCPECGRMKG